MQTLARGGYTDAQVRAALQGLFGTRRVEFRYDLLSEDNTLVGDLPNVLSASVSYEGLSDVKRTARFQLAERQGVTIDYLKNRIRPWVRVYVPDLPVPGALRSSKTYDAAVTRVRSLLARWKFDEISGTIAADSAGVTPLILDTGAVPNQSALIEDMGRSVSLDNTALGRAYSEEAGALLNSQTAMSFAGWFTTDNIGIESKLVTSTAENSWSDLLDGDWGGLSTQTWGSVAPPGSSWGFFSTSNWGDLTGSWEDLIPDIGEVSVSFSAAKEITCKISVNNALVTATTPAGTHVADRTFLVFTWASGANMNIYLNGELAATSDSSIIGALSGIGTVIVGSPTFQGRVDDFLLSGAVLTPEVIRDMYVNGAAIGPAAPPAFRYVEFSQGVFLLSSPTRDADPSGVVTRDVSAYDQSVVLKSQKVSEQYYVGAGETYTAAIGELLAATPGLPNYAVVPSAKTLPAQKVWNAGTDHLTIVNDLCSSVNYESLFFDENGAAIVQPYIAPQDRTPEYVYDTSSVSVMVPGASQELDLYDTPNQWILVVSDPDRALLKATYTNNDPSSPTSTVNRGRVVTRFEQDQDAVDQTALNAKVTQLAQESSQVFEEISFETALMPIHGHRDVYRLSYPDLGLDADYSETRWSYPMKSGASMAHVARRVITLNGTVT